MKFDYAKADLPKDELIRMTEPHLGYVRELRHIYEDEGNPERHEMSLRLPKDILLREEIECVYLKTCTDSLKYVVVIGIGGSNLGARAVYDALYRTYDRTPDRGPKLLFADTIDTRLLSDITGLFEHIENACDVLITIITKSGMTTETITNAEIIYRAFEAKFGKAAREQCVVISDVGSALSIYAEEHGFTSLTIPPLVGGRYSVFSAAGLFPLFAAGVDIDAVRAGAEEITPRLLSADPEENSALQSAAVLYHAYQEGKTTNVNFVFDPELESLGKWYRQLLGESIGKRENEGGKTVRVGITPDVSVGSVDMHSVGQLYFGGPEDKMTTFIRTEKPVGSAAIPDTRLFPELIPEIKGKSASDIANAIYSGVKTAYEKEHMPYMEVLLADISPYEIGQFLQFKMVEMMYLGRLFNVNPFDQPNVEMYKQETRKILNKKL